MGRILSGDKITRKTEIWHDQADGGVVVETAQDVEPIMLQNKDEIKARRGFKGDGMHHVARIPLSVYEDLKRKGIADDPKAFKRWLDNPDNRAWRTHPGRLGK